MDYTELEKAFITNPYTSNNSSNITGGNAFNELLSAYPRIQDYNEQPEQKVQQQKVILNCDDYENHANRCTSCMYRYAKRRSNFLNIIILITLFWLIFRKN